MSIQFVQQMDTLRRRSLRMAYAVEDLLHEACETVQHVDVNLARRVINRDEEIDREEVAVEAEVIRLITLFQPMGEDMRFLCTVLKVNDDLERIADCAVNLAERAEHIDPELTVKARDDIRQIFPVVQQMIRKCIQAYAESDAKVARQVMQQDELVDTFYADFIKKIVTEGADSSEKMAVQLDLLSVAKNLERIADHISNIAEDVIFLKTGEIIRHQEQT
jgi:phosphate transport system protein